MGARRARRSRARSTSATATTRSATRGPSARRRCGPATRSCGPSLRVLLNRWRQWDWIAAQRVDRYVANSAPHRGARPALLRARVDRPLPAGGDRALPRRRPVGEHYMVLAELMAHKRIDVAVRAFNALGRPLARGRRRARSCGGSSASPGRRSLHRPRQRRARRRAARARSRARGDRHGGVRDRRRRGARGRPARDRAGRGRRARERHRGRDRHVLRAVRAGGAGRGRRGASIPIAIDPAACRAAAERFGAERFRAELRADRRRGRRGRAAPRATASAGAGGASPACQRAPWRAIRATDRDESRRTS